MLISRLVSALYMCVFLENFSYSNVYDIRKIRVFSLKKVFC